MGCARTNNGVTKRLSTTTADPRFAECTDWMPAIGIDKLKMAIKRKSVQLVGGGAPTFNVKPAIQVALVRPDNPDTWAAIAGVGPYVGAGENNTGVMDVSSITGPMYFVRFGASYYLGGGATQGEADVELIVSYTQCGSVVGTMTQELQAFNTTSDSIVAITGWIPAMDAEKVIAAFVISDIANNFRCQLAYRKAETNIQDPSAWSILEGASYRTANGETNTRLLTLTVGKVAGWKDVREAWMRPRRSSRGTPWEVLARPAVPDAGAVRPRPASAPPARAARRPAGAPGTAGALGRRTPDRTADQATEDLRSRCSYRAAAGDLGGPARPVDGGAAGTPGTRPGATCNAVLSRPSVETGETACRIRGAGRQGSRAARVFGPQQGSLPGLGPGGRSDPPAPHFEPVGDTDDINALCDCVDDFIVEWCDSGTTDSIELKDCGCVPQYNERGKATGCCECYYTECYTWRGETACVDEEPVLCPEEVGCGSYVVTPGWGSASLVAFGGAAVRLHPVLRVAALVGGIGMVAAAARRACTSSLDACNAANAVRASLFLDLRQCEFCFANCVAGHGCVRYPGGDYCGSTYNSDGS
jgi:hypothetical protein